MNGFYEDVLDFFRYEVLILGLEPMFENESDLTPSIEPDTWLQSTSLFFSFQEGDCVEINILKRSNEGGDLVEDWVKVSIIIAFM